MKIKKYLLVTLITLFSLDVVSEEAEIVLYNSGCRSYFVADGPKGFYLLEWYGGFDPAKGDIIVGDIASYGFKDVYYPNQKQDGRIWVDDYMLSKDRVLEKYYQKCN